MKKLLFFVICLMFIPTMVNAKEYCKISKGTGKNIGDEIQCGTENFYVVSNKNGNVDLLAKYNLFVGDIINYVEVNKSVYDFDSEEAAYSYCESLANAAGYHPYNIYFVFDNYSASETLLGCRIYEKIEYDRVVQDKRAVGTKLDGNGRSILPLYGITYMNPEWGYDALNGSNYVNNYDSNGDLILTGSSFENYINGYKSELERQNIDVSSVSFITLEKTLKLLKDISGQDVEVDLQYSGGYDEYDPEYYTGKMDIKNFVGNNKWIYDITYWLGSGFKWDNFNNTFNDYYISNEGMLCAIGRGECVYMPYPIGNGVRPLVTVPESALAYMIRVKTDGNGTIEVVDAAKGNENITFKVTSKKGYKLSKLIITTDSGEKVEFNEGSIINNSDGTVSINNNAFTMPFESVTIEAQWTITNPKTKNSIIIYSSLLILIGVGSLFVVNKRGQLKENKKSS